MEEQKKEIRTEGSQGGWEEEENGRTVEGKDGKR